ncbi:MAG TPA: response regulator [Nevskia sp.]|nr:response regulator [Nevskia sp.]
MNIVLLEDDADAREAMAALLSLDHHQVRQAHDGASFRNATSDLSGQAVIFDLCLGGGASGLHLVMDYQRRRHDAGLEPARLIALSGSGDPARTIAAAEPPFAVHHSLAKPADHARILAALAG